MKLRWRAAGLSSLAALALVQAPRRGSAQAPDSTLTGSAGEHDFDFELGAWTIHRRRLERPLSGSHNWVESAGALHLVRKVWGGRASLAEFRLEAPSPHFAGSLLHLYNPQSHQWSLYWASAEDGSVAAPLVGEFRNGRGEFFNQESFQSRAIFVRVVYSDITRNWFRTERFYSTDGGATWELNAVDSFTRREP